MNVKTFGAVGDNRSRLAAMDLSAMRAAFPLTEAQAGLAVTDEFDWCAIQETILTALQTDVEEIYIPAGSYRINRPLVVPLRVASKGQALTVRGAGNRGNHASGTLLCATLPVACLHICGLTTVTNLAMMGADTDDPQSIGILIGSLDKSNGFVHNNCVNVVLNNIRFGSGFYNAIESRVECDQLHISHCTAYTQVGNAAIYLSNRHNVNRISPSAGVVIEQCQFSSGSLVSERAKYGIYLLGTENSAIRNCTINGFDHAIYLDGASGVRNDGLQIEGIHAEINDAVMRGSTRWTPQTAYALGDRVRPQALDANGWVYKCIQAGVSGAQPTWPMSYGATALDGTAVWQAYKRSVFLEVANNNDAISGGLSVRGVWAQGFIVFINMAQRTSARIRVSDCTLRSFDMIYLHAFAIRHSLMIENSYLDGSIRPYATLAQTNQMASVLLRFCQQANDLVGVLGNSAYGVSSFFTGEPNYSRSSSRIVSLSSEAQWIDPINDSHVQVESGPAGGAVELRMPVIEGRAWVYGLEGKTVTVTHVGGLGVVSVLLAREQPAVYGGQAAALSIDLSQIGDSVTLCLAVSGGGLGRWIASGTAIVSPALSRSP